MSATGRQETPPPRQRRALLRYQRSQETRERIAVVALRLFRETGYDSVTVEEICTAAGVSRSSYYFHFDGKEALLGELDAMTARRAKRLPQELLARAMVRAMQGLPYVGQLPDPDADFGHALAESFRRAQARDEISADPNPAELGAILASMLMEGMLRWASRATPAGGLEDVLRWRAALFLAGVRHM